MDLERLIRQTLEYFEIPMEEAGLMRILRFLVELDRWNRKMNLVGLKDIARVCRELLADSFFLHTFVGDRHRLVDVGSGSGILAVPLAVLNEAVVVHSVDSNLKKIQFQRHVRRTLDLRNLLPLEGRIEVIDPLNADGLVAKAYGTTEAILTAADRHLAPGGLVFITKGGREEGKKARGYLLENTLSYSLPGVAKDYRLLIYKKIS